MTLTPLAAASKIYVDTSAMTGAGRGVFAKERIEEGELIEQCPVVALEDPKDRDRLRKTGLVNYYFLWGEKRDHAAICLGWGAVYNHSFSPNATYEKVMDDLRMDFTALYAIEAGEEILVNYNGAPDDTTPLRIPGIPVSAGGVGKPKHPRLIDGLLRRARLLAAWLSRPGAASVLVLAGL
ncbi:MAG: SET domain-containing protein [Patescibacteria group bacterium]